MLRPGLIERGLAGRGRLKALLAARSRLEVLVALHRGPRLFKWQHYYRIYDSHLRRHRRRGARVLEIGIGFGGSLPLWRRYFGRSARILGIDVNPDCRRHAGGNVSVEIGDQGDPAFLERIAREHGPFDVVIDDGSHAHAHQLTSFRTLFPHIRDGGVYACEDLCSSYWQDDYGGGVGVPGTYVEFLKSLIDEINGWYWREGFADDTGSIGRHLEGVHFHPALVVIEKRLIAPPVLTHVGTMP
jgi:SAM-dependent methyltransferase